MEKIFITICLAIPFLLPAQLQQHVLSNSLDDVREAAIGDIDGDGDLDIFFWFNTLHWYEQVDISQNEWTYHEIGHSGGQLDLIDVDNDGDNDFVVQRQGKLFYLENINSLGTELLKHDVYDFSNSSDLQVTELVDLDGDGDLDFVGDGVTWAENLDGNFNFGEEQLIYDVPEDHIVSFDMNFADWNNDTTLDIILNVEVATATNQIQLIKNLGDGNFSEPEILVESFPSWDWAYTRIADVDFDNDIDIIVHGGPQDILWLKNNGSSFDNPILIHEYFSAPGDLEVVDINNDGLLDVFWSGHGGVFWKENLGGFTFADEPKELGPDQANQATMEIEFADLDQDGDLDLLRMGTAISGFPQKFSWYENNYPILVNTAEVIQTTVTVYPNPASDFIQIEGTFDFIEIYNAQGIRVVQSNESTLNISQWPDGIYFISAHQKDKRYQTSKFLKH